MYILARTLCYVRAIGERGSGVWVWPGRHRAPFAPTAAAAAPQTSWTGFARAAPEVSHVGLHALRTWGLCLYLVNPQRLADWCVFTLFQWRFAALSQAAGLTEQTQPLTEAARQSVFPTHQAAQSSNAAQSLSTACWYLLKVPSCSPSQHLCFPCTKDVEVFREYSLQKCSSHLPCRRSWARNRHLVLGMTFHCTEAPASRTPGQYPAAAGGPLQEENLPCSLSQLPVQAFKWNLKKNHYKAPSKTWVLICKLMLSWCYNHYKINSWCFHDIQLHFHRELFPAVFIFMSKSPMELETPLREFAWGKLKVTKNNLKE